MLLSFVLTCCEFQQACVTTKNNVQGYMLHVWACTIDLRLPLTLVQSLTTQAIYAALSASELRS